MKSEKSLEIRTTRKARILGSIAGWGIRLLGKSLRCEVVGDAKGRAASPEPMIHVLWHNQILVAPYLWRKLYPQREVAVLTSASGDGALLAAAVKVFRVDSVHGSSSRRAVAALVALRQAVRDGKDLVFTPDGPRGPRYHLQPGAIKIAQTSGCVIQPMRLEFESAWILKTWDAFRIPKPFSKVRLHVYEPVTVPRKLSDDEFETIRMNLEAFLRAGIPDAVADDGNNH